MRILAIESSCDETSAAVLEDGRTVLSNIISSQIPIHRSYGGVVPEIASRKHIEAISPVIEEALRESQTDYSDLDLIAVTRGPGLIGCLLVGISAAKALALRLDIPIVGVNHMAGHIAANYISHPDLEPPFISLVVSGGHTYLIHVLDYNRCEIVGTTLDDAAGEAYDKVARALGLPYPGGPEIEKAAQGGDGTAYDLPRVLLKDKGYNFSFSGLKTAVLNTINSEKMAGRIIRPADMAASFQECLTDILTEKAFRLVRDEKAKLLTVSGGVSANKALRKKLLDRGEREGVQALWPEPVLCTDNAAMIGCAGYYDFLAHGPGDLRFNASPNLELNE